MLELFGQLLPQLVGLMIAPTTIIVTVVMLSTANPIRKVSFMMIGGFISLMGLGYFAHFLGSSTAESGGVPLWQALFDLTAGLLFAVLGILQIRASRKPNAAGPGWLALLDKFTWWQSLAVGLYLGALNPKGIALILQVGEAVGSSNISALAGFAFMLGFSILALASMFVPLLIALLAGKHANTILAGLRAFMSQHNNVIMIVLFTVLAAVFIGSGLEGLASE